MTPLELNNIIYTQDSPDNVDGTAQSVNNEVISEIQSDEMASAKKGTKSKKDTPRKIKAVKQREKENSTRKRSQIYPLLIFPLLSFLVTNKSGERSTCTVSLYPSSIKDMVAYICAACKTNYINMQEKYDNMQYNYVDMVIKLLIEYYNMYMNNMSKF